MIQSGKQTIKQGEAWVEENPEAWQALKDAVRVDLQLYPDQEMRINYYVEQLRNRKHVSIDISVRALMLSCSSRMAESSSAVQKQG